MATESRPSGLPGNLLVGLLFIAVGGTVVYFSLDHYCARKYVLNHGVTTEARVVEVIRTPATSGKKHGKYHYYPVVSFTDTQGYPQRVRSPRSYYMQSGAKTQITYLPENPQRLEILPPKQMIVLLLFAGGGGLFCLGGLTLWGVGIRNCVKR